MHLLSSVAFLQDSIGASGQQAAKARKSRLQGFKPTVVTCPYGACDPVTNVSRFTKFIVPEAYVHPSLLPYTNAARNPPETTSRMAFQQRSAQEMAASLLQAQAQVEESRKLKV
jgi:DNA topoisomerase IB